MMLDDLEGVVGGGNIYLLSLFFSGTNNADCTCQNVYMSYTFRLLEAYISFASSDSHAFRILTILT